MLGNTPVAVVKPDTTPGTFKVYSIHADHLDAPRVIVDNAGQTVWRWDSDAFGVGQADEDPDADGIPFHYNLRFPGQYFDAETSLHYNYFRDYDPVTGRYIASDPIGLAGGLNTFGYVGGNPVGAIDPLGLICAGSGCHDGGGASLNDFLNGLTPSRPLFPLPTPAPNAMASVGDAIGAAASQAAQAVKDACPCPDYKNIYAPNDDKHGGTPRPGPRGTISGLPSNGQTALDNSAPVNNDLRIGYDPTTGEIVILRRHFTDEHKCEKYWHGYVVTQSDLTSDQWRAGRDAGFPKWPRKPR